MDACSSDTCAKGKPHWADDCLVFFLLVLIHTYLCPFSRTFYVDEKSYISLPSTTTKTSSNLKPEFYSLWFHAFFLVWTYRMSIVIYHEMLPGYSIFCILISFGTTKIIHLIWMLSLSQKKATIKWAHNDRTSLLHPFHPHLQFHSKLNITLSK